MLSAPGEAPIGGSNAWCAVGQTLEVGNLCGMQPWMCEVFIVTW